MLLIAQATILTLQFLKFVPNINQYAKYIISFKNLLMEKEPRF